MNAQEASEKYGPILDGKFRDESHWMVTIDLSDLPLLWVNWLTGKPVTHIYCNRDFAPYLRHALDLVIVRKRAYELKTFDGCFMVRDVRGSSNMPSAHSYGIAIDLNAKENPLGGPIQFSLEFRQCFKDAGLVCGADFHRVDGMHLSLGW